MNCRQPLGTSEHRACIGLAYINFTSCHCESKSSKNSKLKPAVTNTKRKLPSWLSTSDPETVEVPEKKSRASLDQDMNLKVEESRKNPDGAGLVEPSQRVPSQARFAGNDNNGEEPISRSNLKRQSSDAKETRGKEAKKAKLDKGSPTSKKSHLITLSGTSQSEENELDRDHAKRKSNREKLVQGESSQRKLPLSREGKGKASKEENQVLGDVHPGSKNGPAREFSKLLVRS